MEGLSILVFDVTEFLLSPAYHFRKKYKPTDYIIVLRRCGENFYGAIKFQPRTICYLAFFLGEDIRNKSLEFYESLENTSNGWTSGTSYECIVENGMVLVFPDWHNHSFTECIEKRCYSSLSLKYVLDILRHKTKGEIIFHCSSSDAGIFTLRQCISV